MSSRRGRGGGGGSGDKRTVRGGSNNGFHGSNTRNNSQPNQRAPWMRDLQDVTKRNNSAQRGGATGRNRNTTRVQSNQPIAPRAATPFQSNDSMNSTPFPAREYQKRYEYLRNQLPSIKEELIKQGLMNPDGPMRLQDAVRKRGLCKDMCPELERVRRIVQNDVKAPECTPETAHGRFQDREADETRMVKAYSRSAAGVDEELVTSLRTPETCLKSMRYMVERLDNEPFDFLQAWIWDRSRAIRKDLTSQSGLQAHDINAYLVTHEEIGRFHLVSLQKMAQDPPPTYSHQQDLEQLMQTLLSIRHRYDDNRRQGIRSPNEPEFLAYRILLSLVTGNYEPVNEVDQKLKGDFVHPSSIRKNRRIQTALKIHRAATTIFSRGTQDVIPQRQEWVDFWNLIRSSEVSYMMGCAAAVSFNRLRHHILETIFRSYKQGSLARPISADDWTIDNLVIYFGFDDEEQVRDLCNRYNLKFDFNSEGREYLKTSAVPYNPRTGLAMPESMRAQFYSKTLIEDKRHGRSYSALISGMSVRDARFEGMVEESEQNAGTGDASEENVQDDDDSLFVPEASSTKPNGITLIGSADTNASTPRLNPFATPFQPSATPNANPFLTNSNHTKPKINPFSTGAQKPVDSTGGKLSVTGDGLVNVRPGLFDPSKNPIQFAKPAATHGTCAQGQPANPFSKAVPVTSASKNPFALAIESTHTVTSSSSTSSPFTSATSTAPLAIVDPASLTGNSTLSYTLGPLLGSSEADNSHPQTAAHLNGQKPPEETAAYTEEMQQRQAAEESKRVEDEKRALEHQKLAEQQRIAATEQQRVVEQQRILEEQKKRFEQQKRLAEEQWQQRVREEQERYARMREQQEQQQRAQEMVEREALANQEREKARDALANQVMFEGPNNLIELFIEKVATEVSVRTQQELEAEMANKLAEEVRQRRRWELARAACAKWCKVVHQRKERVKGRERRKKWRESSRAQPYEVQDTPSPTAVIVPQLDGTRTGLKKPHTPPSENASAIKQKTTKMTDPKDNSTSKVVKKRSSATRETAKTTSTSYPKPPQKQMRRMSVATNLTGSAKARNGDYSAAYYASLSKEPRDRTQTRWFELRAQGLDPSKILKRGYGEMSPDNDDEESVTEPKRARPAYQYPLRPAKTLEETIERLNALKEKLPWSTSTLSSSRRNSSVNGSVTNSSPEYSLPNTHSEFRRSVPNLVATSSPAPKLSLFGRSIGADPPGKLAAYHGRDSKFVPRHLYGKGEAAVRAYRDQIAGRSPRITEPLELSSPVSTQQSYIQTAYTREQADEAEYVEGHDGDTEEDDQLYDEGDYDYPDLDEVGAEQHLYYQNGEHYDEDSDSAMSEADGPVQQYAQKPGGTQDDAIELSD